MYSFRAIAGTCALLLACGSAIAAPSNPSTDTSISAVIAESIAAYPGRCPCPYNTDRRGYACGRRSAYSRAGGYGPKCYPSDVTAADIERYRASHGR